VKSQTAVIRENRTSGDLDELVRPYALAPAVAVGYAQKNGSAAIESPMPPTRELPQPVQVSAHDGVVGAAQGPISTDSEVRGANHHARFVAKRAKGECNQFSSSTVRASSASMISLSVIADSVKPGRLSCSWKLTQRTTVSSRSGP
jgi:hypothetical protein